MCVCVFVCVCVCVCGCVSVGVGVGVGVCVWVCRWRVVGGWVCMRACLGRCKVAYTSTSTSISVLEGRIVSFTDLGVLILKYHDIIVKSFTKSFLCCYRCIPLS